MPRPLRLFQACSVAALLLLVTCAAFADTITTYTVTTTVYYGNPQSGSTSLDGTFVFNDTTNAFTSWSFNLGNLAGTHGYNGGSFQFQAFQGGSYTLDNGNSSLTFSNNDLDVFDNLGSWYVDLYLPFSNVPGGLEAGPYQGDALLDENYPAFGAEDDYDFARGSISASTVTTPLPTPEPATWTLLATGLGALLALAAQPRLSRRRRP